MPWAFLGAHALLLYDGACADHGTVATRSSGNILSRVDQTGNRSRHTSIFTQKHEKRLELIRVMRMHGS